jgi:Flp pilus assembly protein TadG
MCVRKIVSEQKGAVAIMVAISSIILLGMAAFVIDFGYSWATTNELQNAADAGALAGARALGKFYCPEEAAPAEPCKDKADQDNTTIAEVETAIKDAVKDVVNQNKAANLSISIDVVNDIEIGTWDGGAKVFTLNATPPDAVRVRTRRDATTNGPIKTFLGNIFGVAEISLSKPATAALSGVSKVNPGALDVPFGVSAQRDCANPTVKLQDTKSSCAGWTGFFGATNENDLLKLINDMHAGTFDSPEIKIGDSLNWDGGVKAPLFGAFYQFWQDKCTLVGSTCTWEVYVPVYADAGSCDNPNGAMPVVGFATMKITKVDCKGGGKKACLPGADNVIEGDLTCKVEPGRGGGSDKWAIGSIPGLVQ